MAGPSAALSKTSSAPKTPFHCETCDKRFKRRCEYRQHMETHSNAKSYLCSKCSCSYGAERSRIRHVERVHIRVKPYSCRYEDCGRTWARDYLAKEHERQHHGGKYPVDIRTHAPGGEEPAETKVPVPDDKVVLPSGRVLEPLERSSRGELSNRFVRIMCGEQALVMNFFPIWKIGALHPDWDCFVDSLTIRDFPVTDGDAAFLTSSKPVHDARSLGRALRRLLQQPPNQQEPWAAYTISESGSDFDDDADSDSDVSVISISSGTSSSQDSSSTASSKRKRSEKRDEESETQHAPRKRRSTSSAGTPPDVDGVQSAQAVADIETAHVLADVGTAQALADVEPTQVVIGAGLTQTFFDTEPTQSFIDTEPVLWEPQFNSEIFEDDELMAGVMEFWNVGTMPNL